MGQHWNTLKYKIRYKPGSRACETLVIKKTIQTRYLYQPLWKVDPRRLEPAGVLFSGCTFTSVRHWNLAPSKCRFVLRNKFRMREY